ncbi:unnamed protein product [Spirodela intermedia]|uniref:Uncharacterized protein n=1 Tax=Spirodela intermedia TaxID=51605 RepID=A0A7I8IAM4_SPIIN|nr:unnamed protein product [Spirodela intermedia]CAA6653931.1 unnamed protein product [Spirodela intermedia]
MLKQRGSTREYMQRFLMLLLDIPMMPEELRIEFFLGNDEEEIKEGINSFEIINCLQPIQRQSEKSLVYVEVEADEETVAEMVDSGATSNFISLEEVQRIGLKVEPTKTRFKAADSSTQSLIGE